MSEEKKSEKKDDSPSLGWFVFAPAGVVLIILSAIWLFVPWLYPDSSMQGQFGDMFGGANALFSGLAFIGIIYTMCVQRIDLKRQHSQNTINQEYIKISARREERRYRNDVLPVFVFEGELSQTGKRHLDFVEFKQTIKNIGHTVADPIFTQNIDEKKYGAYKDHLLGGDLLEKNEPYISENEELELSIWCPDKESHNTQKFSLSFKTKDGVIWLNEFIVEILDGKVENYNFYYAEDEKKVVEDVKKNSLS